MNFGSAEAAWHDFIWLGSLICLTRLIPHPADFSPLWALACWIRTRWPWYGASLILLSSNLISDLLLGGEQSFGTWAWFTYSALFITLLILPAHWAKRGSAALGAAFGFWLWTNMGVWLTSAWYPHSWAGLSQCFTVALPFLSNSLLATGLTYGILRHAMDNGTQFYGLKNA